MGVSIYLSMDLDVGTDKPYRVDLFDANITHNVVPMWSEAKVYDAIYNSDGHQAKEYIDVLKAGLHDMNWSPLKYQNMVPVNRWGTYEDALNFLKMVTNAFEKFPNATIEVSR